MSSGAVVTAHELRRPASLSDETIERGDGGVGVDPPATLDGESLASELVEHMQQLQDPAVGGLVELEVQCPHVVWVLGGQASGRHRRDAQSLSLSSPERHSQSLLAPQTLDALAVDAPTLLAQHGMSATVALARTLARELTQALPERSVVASHA